jgi:hypothetical protein
MHATKIADTRSAKGHSRSRAARIAAILAAFLSATVALTGATFANAATPVAAATHSPAGFPVINLATRNPHANAHFAHGPKTVHVRGIAYDPDKMAYPVIVYVYSNGRRIAKVRASAHSHSYAVIARLPTARNRILVIARNYGLGTHNSVAGRTVVRVPVRSTSVGGYRGNQAIAARMLASYHWGSIEMPALVNLWNRESGWRVSAANPSGAYGIPQALPGSKMASAGANWRASATTQIRWGLSYIRGVYGSPRGAWAHSQSYGWY